MYRQIIKPLIDFLLALMALILLSPIIFFIAIALLLGQGGNPFFIQSRPGKNERIFRLIKFRTMSHKKDKHGSLLPDDQRLTRIGRFVRSTSLDELPQLFNVLTGSMSLVGPRPLLKKYLDRYSPKQARRHEVKPGITGWAQVNGRNAISWERKFELDVYYVDHLSLKLDLKIIGRTIGKVLKRKGITAANSSTMPEFKGIKNEEI